MNNERIVAGLHFVWWGEMREVWKLGTLKPYPEHGPMRGSIYKWRFMVGPLDPALGADDRLETNEEGGWPVTETQVIVFEDKQMERDLSELIRSNQFRRLRRHIMDEASAEDGKPAEIAEALGKAITAHLLDFNLATGAGL